MDTARTTGQISRKIVSWFNTSARDLPWRRTRDPYAIWISEVMLQQTQVKTVIPYWERWMARFPRIQDLAAAEEESVLKAWEGLGYYRRARNLQKAARIVLDKFGGVFPTKFEDVLELPGIGRYTAGAVCSIAFGQAVPVLDGNVARVLSRVCLVSAQNELWDAAEKLVKATSDPSALNQGLMELGALICTPRDPVCPQCPLKSSCRASRKGRVGDFPKVPEKAAVRRRRFVALILRNGDAVLIRKRDAHLVNGALWEFPNFEIQRGNGSVTRQLSSFMDSDASSAKRVSTIKHSITNNRITLTGYAAETKDEKIAERLDALWTPIAKLAGLPFSSAHGKLRKLIEDGARSPNPGETA
jgi:A/G-specific adenine glycosylase